MNPAVHAGLSVGRVPTIPAVPGTDGQLAGRTDAKRRRLCDDTRIDWNGADQDANLC